jgi:hypothetical protein
MQLLNKIKCLIFDHDFDWQEYDGRLSEQEEYTELPLVFCKRCNMYKMVDALKGIL